MMNRTTLTQDDAVLSVVGCMKAPPIQFSNLQRSSGQCLVLNCETDT